jgi:LysM repeat protein
MKTKRVSRIVLFVVVILALGLPAPPVVAQTTPCGPVYTVQSGDSMWLISQRCNVSLASLLAANPQITNPRVIFPGQQINISSGVAIPVTGPQITTYYYIVKPGDNLDYLADRLKTTVDEIVSVNPALQEDRTLYRDQIIALPGDRPSAPMALVSPTTGPPGTPVRVVADGFPANVNVDIGVGLPGTHYIVLAQQQTDDQGRLDTRVNLPLNAPLNDRWVFVVDRRDRVGVDAVSNFFYIVDRRETVGEFEYLIRPGDTLSWIANRFGLTVNDILEANPQITDPRRIFAGRWLLIPGEEVAVVPGTPTVTLTPQTVQPGWTVNVMATGYPANTELRVLLGIPGEQAVRSHTVQTDQQGAAFTQVEYPQDADPTRQWVVWVVTADGQTDAIVSLETGTAIPVTGQNGDIRPQLGAPTWRDTFAQGNNWLLSRGVFTEARVEDGRFVLTGLTSADGWRLGWPRIENSYVEMTVNTGECSGSDRYGLFVNVPTDRDAPQTGNLIGFTCNGHYFLRRWDDGSGAWLINPTRSAHINIGPNQVNRVGVLVAGERLAIYANGILLDEFVDPTYAGEGRFGIFVGAQDTENLTIYVDEIAYWRID